METSIAMSNKQDSELFVLFTGYSSIDENEGTMLANCSTTLIKGPINVIIDTRTAWDAEEVIGALYSKGLSTDDINYVICTHGHSDHIGCNYLFKKAIHIVGFSISSHNKYFLTPDFSKGEEYIISKNIKVIPTPGHTLQDVSVLFTDSSKKTIAITGDLFERRGDLLNDDIWIQAGSDSVDLQRKNRRKILEIANYIIPGHGELFIVPKVKFTTANKILIEHE